MKKHSDIVDVKSNPLADDETWIEVTNKANQTPSHWVYDDMLNKEQVVHF